MKRRSFLENASLGAVGGATLAAPAIVRAQPQLRWRMTSSFPKSLDTLFGVCPFMAQRVKEMTDGKFEISTHAAGEIVPGLQVLDAVQAGTVECGQTAPYYYFGKDMTWAFGTAVPFGLNYRQYNAWWHFGGGEKIYNEFAGKQGILSMICGNTGAQMGGWFRKEIKAPEDLKGLKFRVGGVAGIVLSKLGAVPQQIAGGDIYPALEKGTIDAAEWVGPYDDEKLGFNKIARYYYTVGWWEGGPALHLFVNRKAWDALPKIYQEVLRSACGEGNIWTMAKYDRENPAALRRLIASGTQLRQFPKSVMDACYKATQEMYAEHNAKNPEFKKIYDSYFGFQKESTPWMRVTENFFDDYMATVLK
jgi:TRAP-type mannitol/chloroaromatic compound transport system substrate-binding protein